jgi:hypothetical protein
MRVTVAFAVRLVHAFMQHLGLFPRVLVAGRGDTEDGGGAEEDRGGFHGGNRVRHPIARSPSRKWQFKVVGAFARTRKRGRKHPPPTLWRACLLPHHDPRIQRHDSLRRRQQRIDVQLHNTPLVLH